MSRQEEALLKMALQKQLEEDLSKVPPEHEIYRMHSFSENFLQRMKELIRETKDENKSRIIPFRKWSALAAACLVLVVGLSLLPLITRKQAVSEAEMAAMPQEAPMAVEDADSIKAEQAGLPFEAEAVKAITIRWWDGETQTEVVRTTSDEELIREFCALAADSHLEFSQLANQALYPAEMSCLQAELKDGSIWETYSREETFKELIP